MSRDLARIIVRQYPPRRDALWNPGLFKQQVVRRSDAPRETPVAALLAASLAADAEQALTLPQRLWANEDVRHFTMTFTFAFVGLTIFFA